MTALPALARTLVTWLYGVTLELWSYALAQTHQTHRTTR